MSDEDQLREWCHTNDGRFGLSTVGDAICVFGDEPVFSNGHIDRVRDGTIYSLTSPDYEYLDGAERSLEITEFDEAAEAEMRTTLGGVGVKTDGEDLTFEESTGRTPQIVFVSTTASASATISCNGDGERVRRRSQYSDGSDAISSSCIRPAYQYISSASVPGRR